MRTVRGGGLGIDVGAHVLHCVELASDGRVLRAESIAVDDPDELEGLLERLVRMDGGVAIDGPSAPSLLPHDADPSLSPKFRRARCGEIALGRARGIWVPWVTPAAGEPMPGWMAVAIRVHAAFSATGTETLETYPQAIFRTLADATLAPKSTVEGKRHRVGLLERAGVVAPGSGTWGHDWIDAAGAALVALHRATGRAVAVTCPADGGFPHDGSAIWLPGRG